MIVIASWSKTSNSDSLSVVKCQGRKLLLALLESHGTVSAEQDIEFQSKSACILFHIYHLILRKVFKAMSINKQNKNMTCCKTGNFFISM